MKSIVSEALLSSLQEQAQALLNASDISPLLKAQYQFQADWLVDDIATVEFLLFPSYGQAITPTPGSAYITLNVGHMVSGYSHWHRLLQHSRSLNTSSIRSAAAAWYVITVNNPEYRYKTNSVI